MVVARHPLTGIISYHTGQSLILQVFLPFVKLNFSIRFHAVFRHYARKAPRQTFSPQPSYFAAGGLLLGLIVQGRIPPISSDFLRWGSA